MSLKDHEMKGTDGRTINAWGRALREVGGLERFYSADDNSWSSFKLLKQIHLDVLQLFGWSQIKMPQLRILNLTGCTGLLMTPDLSGFEKLEILILEHCSRLVNIDASIAQLKCLVTLNLKFCTELSMLPKELNDMKEMRELLIDGTSIREIPSALANMKKLKILSAPNCFSLSGLPESIGQLEALSVLLLDSAKIVELPDSIGELVQLKQLSLRNCHCLGELPDSIGKLGSTLFELDVSGTGVSKLPASIRNLRNLKVLKMDSCFIREFPHDIGRLTNLEEMHALRCRSLEGDIPSDIGELKSLRTLVLGYTRISSLPPCIQSLCCLQTLDLLHCDRIEALPILPSSLTHLHVISRNMKVVPSIDNLTKLEELCLGDEDFKEIKLPSTHRMMNFIPDQGGGSLLSLAQKVFKAEGVGVVSFMDHGPLLEGRMSPSAHETCRVGRKPQENSATSVDIVVPLIREVEGLGELGALEIIDISHCEIRNLEGLGQLTSLISLTLSDCDHLRELPNISNLKMLKILEIRRCREIKNIQGLQEIRSSLEKLHVGERKDEDSLEEAVEDKDIQGDCGPGPLPQCPQQPEKHAEHKLLPVMVRCGYSKSSWAMNPVRRSFDRPSLQSFLMIVQGRPPWSLPIFFIRCGDPGAPLLRHFLHLHQPPLPQRLPKLRRKNNLTQLKMKNQKGKK
ncbi:hypothetical protein NL676_033970 [Syzygium grande]|nr:hypothetical protein NL676_033970 [Syzygium grande]